MEPLTTAVKIKSIANHLKSLPDTDLAVYIEDASLEVSSSSVPEAYRERAVRYLAAHLASLNVRQVQQQKVADMSQTYQDGSESNKGLDATAYGQEYARLLKRFAVRPSLNLTVL
ncbi:DUF4054 domain-containing protein [Indiicoccus explosivorum]|uniref:DUF4054 domain-containing protein n=1 Tax=Indiicoccus explosivorum TaxID=1917864 RepID=UPI000B451CFF|nr:DUF4054 domain-containing protein [Indiicoccus explosivorum]